MAGAPEPADDAGEGDGAAIERRVPGHGAAEVRALPIQCEQAARAADAKDIALGACEVRKPELTIGDARRVGAGADGEAIEDGGA